MTGVITTLMCVTCVTCDTETRTAQLLGGGGVLSGEGMAGVQHRAEDQQDEEAEERAVHVIVGGTEQCGQVCRGAPGAGRCAVGRQTKAKSGAVGAGPREIP